jgi:Ni,Fe-hydrogenase III large subunit/Ni,Fe-hydrogenase III component G
VTNGNEVRATVRVPSNVPGVCASIRDVFRARLAMIACSDERKIAGGFALRYFFEAEEADVFIVLVSRMTQSETGSPPTYPSVAMLIPSSTSYEREIKDMFGLVAEGSPDPRPLVLHEQWPVDVHPLRKEYPLETKQSRVKDGRYRFLEVEGEGVSEIPVGPVHAGIIEPGHFRFSVLGETVVNLETRLYYTHRGVEKLAESLSIDQAVLLSERISGDEAVANSTAFCQSIEKIAGILPPVRAMQVRVVCAEMERIYNHLGTLAALSLDSGFAYGYARLALLKEMMMRLNEDVSGSRLLFGVNTIGGVNINFTEHLARRAAEQSAQVRADFEKVVKSLRSESSVMDRLSGTGRIQMERAVEMGLLGVAARSSGVDCDTRRDHPYGAYRNLKADTRGGTRRQLTERMIQMAKASGDVLARFDARVEEVMSSVEMVKEILRNLDGELELKAPVADDMLEPFGNALGYAESHRGQTLHWVMVGEDGRSIFRYKVRTASFANWPAIELAVLNDIVADFPLINKSLDLSYAGNDL